MKTLKALLLLSLPACLMAQPGDSLRSYELNPVQMADVLVVRVEPLETMELSPHQIQGNRAAATTAEALQSIPSAYIRSYQPGGLSTLSLRGTGASHTQLYWLGVPLNAPTLGQNDLSLGLNALQGLPGLHLGGSSLQLGSGGLGGAIAYDPNANGPDSSGLLHARVEGGSFGTLRALVQARHYRLDSAGRFIGTTGVGYSRAANNFSFQNTTLPGQPIQRLAHAQVSQGAAMQHFLYNAGRAGTFTLDAYGQAARRNLPPTMLSADQGEQQQDAGIRARLGWGKHHSRFLVATWVAALHDTMRYQNATAAIDAPSAFTRLVGEAAFSNLRHIRRIALDGGAIRIQQDMASSGGIPVPVRETLLSGYLRGSMWLLPRGYTTVILRQEWRQGQWSLPLFTLGHEQRYGIRQVQRIHLQLSHNQHWPTLNDRYWQPGGNPALRPETAMSAVFGLSREHRVFRTFMATLQAKAHAQQVKDWILWIPGSGNIWSPQNIGRVRVLGTEAGFTLSRMEGANALVLELEHAYTRAQQVDAAVPGDSALGKQLIYTPMHQARARLHGKRGPWALTLNGAYTGRRFTTRDNSSSLPAFATLDAMLAREIQAKAQQWRLYLLGQNLTGMQYQSIAWRPMPRQAVYLGIEWKIQ